MRILEKLLVRKQQILLFEGLGSINLKKKKKDKQIFRQTNKKKDRCPRRFHPTRAAVFMLGI